MTTLNSLEVQGIRSFSPDKLECLYFEKPLTLIVGHNGSGKTTLIECLKAVTSGILPPNSDKGKCFVYDYRLNNSNEVRGHIKLSFTTFNNEKVSVSRSYSIAGDKYNHKKTTFKGTENILEVELHNGKVIYDNHIQIQQKRCVTMKTTDIDLTLPSLMGFTRAIIDNVIFCHQDENNWPLDDLAKVKARFDDLLETSRYTKALVVINKAKKEQEDVIRNKQKQLEIYKSQILQIADIKKQLDNDKDDIIKTKLEIEALENSLKQSTEILTTLKSKYDKIASNLDEYRNTEGFYLKTKEEHDKLHESLAEIYEESLDDIKQYHATLTAELRTSESKNSILSGNIEKLVRSLNDAHMKLRESKDIKNSYFVLTETKRSAEEMLKKTTTELISELNIIDETNISEIELKIKTLSDISMTEKNFMDKIKECDDEMRSLEVELVSMIAEQKTINISMKSLENEIVTIKNSLSERDNLYKRQDYLKQRIGATKDDISDDVKIREELLNKRNTLKIEGYKIKNTISRVNVTDEEIKSGITLLKSIVDNDKESILLYLKTLSNCNIDRNKLLSTIKRIVEESFQRSDAEELENLIIYKEATNTFFNDFVNMGMCKSCKNIIINSTSIESRNIFEPYDGLVKLITNARIEEYLSYYDYIINNHSNEEASKEEIQKQLVSVCEQIELKDKEITNKKNELERCMNEHESVSCKIDEFNVLDTKMLNLQKHLDNTMEDTQNIEVKLEILRNKINGVSNNRNLLKTELDEFQNKKNLKNSKISMLYKQYRDIKDRLNNIENEITIFGSYDINNDDIETRITEINDEIKEKMKLKTELNDKINEHKRVIDLLHQNIEYKTKHELLCSSEEKLHEIKKQIGEQNIDGLDFEITKMNRECAEITLKIATLNGMVLTKEEHVDKLNTLLESKSIKNAQKMYTETCIELKSHHMTKEDLERYSKVLESGLHKYHSEKIDYINNVLKRVWRDVYSGNYIDYIAIQSNVDENISLSELTSKSYNYRIIMVLQNGMKMDMKGHCSAGERILSSLIIRIALIESFSENCGILALDEPTTNLDKENIRSLELSLSKLVNESFHNFQLIIITHDEEFAKRMATLCSCDKYFRLDKCNDKTKIKIEKI
ncbi:DNA repair protein rad50, putative [Theileria equi strain WA]|uniref:DNA repair protein rad50, putative n=1 Tax=Theileria equi strain WA TaxID=1537102 RepID=L0AU12_THEEQ|nr:DNA repair protein rad50, putative [Theileria equi strain WA]AFZ79035.1 DNA repair protein rad50, putative [Theileria equi strain WA]|eukprot:XP_004828701.1 DNA repair protein rad50, putative [Theileria equi strain WA]